MPDMSLGLWSVTPTFEDANLRIPGPPHLLKCASLSTGRIHRVCRCGTPGPELAPQRVTVLVMEGIAAKVQVAGWSPVWIEASLLRPWQARAPIAIPDPLGPPEDILALQAWIARHGMPKLGRRRREPALGELVWIRERFRAPRTAEAPVEPAYRLFTRDAQDALLVDPEIPLTRLFDACWEEVTRLPLEGKSLGQVLMPVSPLPDHPPEDAR